MSTESAPDLTDTDIFQQLESYPWDQDGEYQIGLKAILGHATEASQIQELTHRAQVFYLARKKNAPINFDAYKAYLSSKPSQEPTSGPNLTSSLNSSSTLPTSTSTPNAASLFNSISTSTSTQEDSLPPPHPVRIPSGSVPPPDKSLSSDPITKTRPTEAPYPPTFAEIVALITSGAPIPGIVEIPPTLIPEQASQPVAKKRRKPWEKDVPEEVVQGLAEGTFGDRRDEVIVQELPE